MTSPAERAPSALTRREALRLLAAGAAAPLLGCASRSRPVPAAPYGPFRMSVATYSLRAFPLERAIAETAGFGLETAEVNPVHLPVESDAASIEAARRLLREAGVRPFAFGVFYTERYKSDRRGAVDRVFALARSLGIRVISCDPEPEWLGPMEERAAESGVRLGLHNHGPTSRYGTSEALLRALEGRHPAVGVTLDTGHALRAGENPAALARALGRRVHGCHLKDNRGSDASVVLGTGDLDLVGTLRSLREVGFEEALSIEYERNEWSPFEDIRLCLAAVREAVQRIA